MDLQPHQQRVVFEKNDLDGKIERLMAFYGSDTFKALQEAEQERLERQIWLMKKYSEVLGERIAVFT